MDLDETYQTVVFDDANHDAEITVRQIEPGASAFAVIFAHILCKK